MRIGRAVLAFVVALMLTGGVPAAARAGDGGTVKVESGVLRGKVGADGRRFLGVPYAAPPTGELRFRPPAAAKAWSGTRDATRAGNLCPQLGLGNEDCLYLNVFTPPAAASKRLPVMVWIPGGAYVAGWGSGYDPTPLVEQGKVIVVTVNYRLGALGFMALPGLRGESGTTGNYGLLDQQAALRWVHRNIGVFGGDSRNVTLFGESAGGNSVCMQMISPGAAGLFQKAISESGACTTLGPVTLSQAYGTSEAIADKAGCTDAATVVACLRAKPASAFPVDLLGMFRAEPLSWVPVVDGSVIKERPATALAAGRYAKVPLISGNNRDEGRLFVALGYHLAQGRHVTAADLKAEAEFRAGANAPQVLAAYPAASDANADLAASALDTDSTFACPALTVARSTAANAGQKVYAYEFADPAPPLVNLDPLMNLGAYHSSEVWYLFKTLNAIPLVAGLNSTQRKLSQQMIGYWTTFAKTGNPNTPGTPTWPAYTTGSPRVQILSSQGITPTTTLPTTHHCSLWP